MTEQQANDAIHLWAMYECFGAPDELDYGDGLPAGHKQSDLESRYRSPQIWRLRSHAQAQTTSGSTRVC